MSPEEFDRAMAPIREYSARMSLGEQHVDWRAAERAAQPRWLKDPAVAPEKPAKRKVALSWAERKGAPLFVSLGSAAAFACGAPEWGFALLIGWAVGTVVS